MTQDCLACSHSRVVKTDQSAIVLCAYTKPGVVIQRFPRKTALRYETVTPRDCPKPAAADKRGLT